MCIVASIVMLVAYISKKLKHSSKCKKNSSKDGNETDKLLINGSD